jgi:hypothetical protein
MPEIAGLGGSHFVALATFSALVDIPMGGGRRLLGTLDHGLHALPYFVGAAVVFVVWH